jgi:hypothetical protein
MAGAKRRVARRRREAPGPDGALRDMETAMAALRAAIDENERLTRFLRAASRAAAVTRAGRKSSATAVAPAPACPLSSDDLVLLEAALESCLRYEGAPDAVDRLIEAGLLQAKVTVSYELTPSGRDALVRGSRRSDD